MPPDDQGNKEEPTASIVPSEHSPLEFEAMLPEGTPTEVRQMVRTASLLMMSGSARANDPLLDKFNDKHVDKFLDGIEKDSQRAHDLAAKELEFKSTNRRYYIAYVSGVLLFLAWVIWMMLPNNATLLSDILKLLIGAVLGFGGGFGYKTYLDKESK